MAMILDYAPGMNLTDPFVFTQTTRVNPSYRFARDGTVALVPPTVTIDNHYIGGVRTALFEIGSTNSCLQSQAWATTPWTNNVTTVTNNAGTAPDGTATASKLLPNNTGGVNNPYVTQGALTIVSGDNLAASWFVKANGYPACVLRCSDSGSTNGFQISFDLANGAFGSLGAGFGAGVLTGKTFVPLANGWYWIGIWGQINAGVVSANVFSYTYDTLAHANTQTAYVADGVSGVLGWGAQLERWGTAIKGAPTSYVPTTTVALARATAPLSTPWPTQTQPLWGYAKLIDLGWSQRAAFEAMAQLSDVAGTTPAFKVFTGSGTSGANPNHRSNYSSGIGANQSSAILSPGANYGDTVELFWQLFGDGSVALQRSINGGAVTAVTNAGASPDFPDFAGNSAASIVFYLTFAATVGLIRLKIGAGSAPITTLAQAASA